MTIVNSASYNLGGVVDFDDRWFQGFTRRVENGLSALCRVLFVGVACIQICVNSRKSYLLSVLE